MTQSDIYRLMSGTKRIEVACGLHDFAHSRLVAHFSAQYPEKDKRAILILVAKRLLGDPANVL